MIPCIKAWSAANPFVLSCCFQIIPVNVFLTPKKLVLVIFNGNTWLEIGSTWRRLFKMTNQLFFSEFRLRNAVTSCELVLNKAKIKMAKWNEIFVMKSFSFRCSENRQRCLPLNTAITYEHVTMLMNYHVNSRVCLFFVHDVRERKPQ